MEKIKQNSTTFYKILSVLIAVVLWAIVAYQEDTVMTRWIKNVPVTVVGADVLDQNGYFITEIDRTTVDVKIKGDRIPLSKITAKDISAMLDVSGISAVGKATLSCDISVDKKNIDISDSRKNTFVVTAEKIVTDIYPVSVNIVGSPAKNYEVFESSTYPSEVTVRGAQSIVSSVYSVSTKSVSVNGVNSGNSVNVGLTAFDEEGKAVSGVTFDPASVEVSYTVLREKTVPLVMVPDKLVLGKKISYEPQDVKIYGEAEVLNSITEIKTVPVDTSKITNGATVTAALSLPYGISAASDTLPITFTVETEIAGSEDIE